MRAPGSIARDLRELGVRLGDALMVHASLRRIGPVEGGADGVIDAIREAIGPHGTMLMTLGARDDWAWVNERPEDERPALLADALPFDARSTPADPDVGVLAEIFRRRPETRVSDHPEGRFGAAGPLARAWLAQVPWHDYYGPGSPLDALVRAGGRVLRLGPDPATTTLLHYAEYLVPLEHKRRVRRHRLVRRAADGGSEVRVVASLDDSDGIAPYLPGRDYFADLLDDYLALDRARAGRVGDAPSELVEAGDLVDFAVTWMAGHLGPAAPEADSSS
jgi:aminoglycoside N3'-acetyltransferase